MIYLAHSTAFDFQNELYLPIRKAENLQSYRFILPHEASDHFFHSQQIIVDSLMLVAEVSFPSIGVGIELAWADAAHKPIVCLARHDCNPSQTLALLNTKFIVYRDVSDMVNQLAKYLQEIELPEITFH